MTLTIFKSYSSKIWAVQHTGKGSERIIELFGTDVLPTAFSLDMPLAEVIAFVQAHNPGDIVTFA